MSRGVALRSDIIKQTAADATTSVINDSAFIAWNDATPVFLYSGGIGSLDYFQELVLVKIRDNNLDFIINTVGATIK